MRRDVVSLWSPAIGGAGEVIAHGSMGRPLITFPSQEGQVTDWEQGGMVDAIRWLIDEGRVKVYSVSSHDSGSWFDRSVPFDERARRAGAFEDWMVNQVVPFVYEDCGGPQEIVLTGCSFGAYHAANFALRRADLFPLAICQSGVYDIETISDGQPGGEAAYFNNPMAYVAKLHGDHLEWLRGRVNLLLICGQGMWEDTTGALDSTRRFAALLREKGIRHEEDLWGYDVPHDWPSWRAQLAHHLPRFV